MFMTAKNYYVDIAMQDQNQPAPSTHTYLKTCTQMTARHIYAEKMLPPCRYDESWYATPVITLANADGLSNFVHCWTPQQIGSIVVCLATP